MSTSPLSLSLSLYRALSLSLSPPLSISRALSLSLSLSHRAVCSATRTTYKPEYSGTKRQDAR
jgi:hypothetical protein